MKQFFWPDSKIIDTDRVHLMEKSIKKSFLRLNGNNFLIFLLEAI